MSDFQLSKQAEPNKIFLTKFSELEGRFDPEYYKSSHKEIISRINFANKTDFLYKVASVLSGSTPAKSDYSIDKSIYPIIKVGSYSKDFIDLSKVAYTKKINHSKSVKNDIYILSSAHQASYVGRFMKYLDKEPEYNTSFVGELLCVRGNNKEYQKYLFTILNTEIYKTLINREKRGQTSHIYPKDIKNIKIPIPPKNIQADIVAKMDKAYQAKQDKEQYAQDLLNSIDAYLLGELGIDMPKATDNSLQSRIFTKKLSEITGERFDPNFHLLDKANQKCSYDFYKLNSLTEIKKGNSITKASITNGNIPVVAGGQKSPYNHHIANYDGNIITVSASGAYAGYVWYHSTSIFASDCTVISLKEGVNLSIQYIAEYLKSQQQYIYNLQQGAAQPHIYPSDIGSLKIPLPPLTKQNKIAEHISKIRDQAKQLQLEAKTELAQAKNEVEAIILGG